MFADPHFLLSLFKERYTENMFDSINTFISLSAIANLLLGAIIFWSGRSAAPNRIYAVNVLAILLWLIGMVLYRSAGASGNIVAVTFLYLSPIFIPATFFHFTHLFPIHEDQYGLRISIVYLMGLALAILTLIPGVIIRGVVPAPGAEKIILWGPLYILYAVYFIFIFSASFLRLWVKYQRGTQLIRRQVIFLLSGYSVAANSAMVTNLILPWVGYFELNWLGQILTLFMVAPTAYAMTEHGLFSVRLVATEVFIFAILLALLFNFFVPAPPVFQAVKIIIFFAVLLIGYLLIRSVLREIEDKQRIAVLAGDLSKANDELKRLDAAKSEFISLAGHQLRTPLTVIKGYTSMMLEGSFGKIQDVAKEALNRVFTSSTQLATLVTDLLDLSRIEAGKIRYEFKDIKIEDIVHGVLKELEETATKKNIMLEFNNENVSGSTVYGDFDKLHEVVINLVDNAVKYSEAGKIVVGLKIVTGQDSRNILLSVKDNGMGIKPEDIPKLFVKFARSEEAKKARPDGMGLGLYLVKKIVEDHHGRVWVESEGLGKGSTFYVELPI